MGEMITIYFPKPIKNSKKFLQSNGINGKKKKIKDGICVQTNSTDFIIYRNRMIIYYMNEHENDIICILNNLINSKTGIGIKIDDIKKRRQIIQLLSDKRYNIL